MKTAFSLIVMLMILAGGALLPILWEESTWGNASPAPISHAEPIYEIQINENQNAILIRTRNGVLIRDLHSGALLQNLPALYAYPRHAAWVPNSSRILMGGRDGHLRMLENVDASVEVFSAHAHEKAILSLTVSKSGTLAATGSEDRICLWDLEHKRLIAHFLMKEADPDILKFSPDEGRLLAGCDDGSLHVFRTKDLHRLQHFALTWDAVSGAIFIENGKRILTGHTHGARYIIDTMTRQVTPWTADCFLNLFCLKISPDQRLIAYTDCSTRIYLYSLKTFEKVATLNGHAKSVSSLSFSETEPLLYSAGLDGTVRAWDLQTFTELDCYQGSLPFDEQ